MSRECMKKCAWWMLGARVKGRAKFSDSRYCELKLFMCSCMRQCICALIFKGRVYCLMLKGYSLVSHSQHDRSLHWTEHKKSKKSDRKRDREWEIAAKYFVNSRQVRFNSLLWPITEAIWRKHLWVAQKWVIHFGRVTSFILHSVTVWDTNKSRQSL